MKTIIIHPRRLLQKQRFWLVLLLLGIAGSQVLQAQTPQDTFWNAALRRIAKPNSKPGWIYFQDSLNINALTVFQEFKPAFRLREEDSLGLKKVKEDDLGLEHYYFDQYYKNVRIEGGEMIVHAKPERNGEFTTPIAKIANGNLVLKVDVGTTPAITASEALGKIFEVFDSTGGDWHRDSTLYPTGELVIHQAELSRGFIPENMVLAWRFDIYAAQESTTFFVDAQTGAILNTIPIAKNCDPGTVATTWYGNQNISVTKNGSSPDNYILLDDCGTHNWKLHIYNFDFSTEVNSSDANFNGNADEIVGGTTHWVLQRSLDYYGDTFGRDSWNGSGGNLQAVSNDTITRNNASWTGGGNMYFGSGNSNSLTTDNWNAIDIGGHELTHGVTEAEAGLNYNKESGALNESFSDIFGEAIERYAKGSNDWLMGADRGAIRSFINPNAFSQPDTYEGTNWVVVDGCSPSNMNDQCGVHTNSGVQNFWFYLLVNGGSGTNDSSEVYAVTGIGFDKAAAIAYRNLTFYLTSTSDYLDAREGSLNAAADLFGNCSNEQIQTGRAWYAVHVGNDNPNFNNQVCGLITSGDYWGINSTIGGGICSNDVIPSAGNVNYAASREVRLLPGFTATGTSAYTFTAYIEPCAITVREAFVAPRPHEHNDLYNLSATMERAVLNTTGIQMTLRPNPAQFNTTLSYMVEKTTTVQVILQDNVGRVLKTLQPSQIMAPGSYNLEINTSDLPAGLFFVSVHSNFGVSTQKMIVLSH